MSSHANNEVDKAYTNPDGATQIAGLVAKAVEAQKIGIANFLRP